MSVAKKSSASVIFALACLLCYAMSTEAMPLAVKDKQDNQFQRNWCIVKPSMSDDQLQRNIDFCCTELPASCKDIEDGGSCYNPTNKVSNASVVMNIYYQIMGKHLHNCNFNNSGILVYDDPSVGSCVYPQL
ncbi:hypothetical protein Pint_24210 [Pistacia integerrima]|uniref:Uncharacterized protein n=1 Tax=Pistacia integerrima TaxID=434235 RepID=A0ACC0YDC9_9ROSI|nr:hypothetical protein Pint_24210 [Pistacia integerrima]